MKKQKKIIKGIKDISNNIINKEYKLFKVSKNNYLINLKVKANSSLNEIRKDLTYNELILNIEEEPINGKANTEIIKFLSKVFNIDKGYLNIVKGDFSKNKVLGIDINCIQALELESKLLNINDI